MHDIAIIGTGPAGISAAITAKLRGKDVALYGKKDLSEKMKKAHMIENYTGLPHIGGEELAAAMNDHLSQMGIEITEKKISAVYAMGDYFSLQCGEEFLEARSVIIATGVVNAALLEGEEKFLGRGVSYCATCDGVLYKGKTVAVIADTEDAAEEANYLAQLASSVLYSPLKPLQLPEADNITIIGGKPKAVTGAIKADTLVTDEGSYPVDCVFVLRDAIRPSGLVPGIETEGAHIKVNISMETSIPGVFACGDIAGLPYQYIKAAGQGNVAALSAVKYLAGKKQQ